jgi:hypothetical protein
MSGDSHDSVMQITPAEFSSAICWSSSIFFGIDLTLVDNIVGISKGFGGFLLVTMGIEIRLLGFRDNVSYPMVIQMWDRLY